MKTLVKWTFLLVGALLVIIFYYLQIHISRGINNSKDSLNIYGKKYTEDIAAHSRVVEDWSKCEQNSSVTKISGFSSLPDRIKEFLYYRHCRHFPLLLDVADKCGGADESSEVFLLLVIKSLPENYERREVLRKTWAQERQHNGAWIRRVFITGTSGSGSEKITFNNLLTTEQKDHHDILQWDFSDLFVNLTLKQILFLEWMEQNCPNARFLLNGDDDVFGNTDNMVKYLQGLPNNDGSSHLFTGNLMVNTAPVRYAPSKYYVPVQIQQSDLYLPYCSGGGYLLSGYTAMIIYSTSKSIELHPIDDVYMGMCLEKAGLSPTHHIGVKTFGINTPSKKAGDSHTCIVKDLLLVHSYNPAKMYLVWHKINDPHLKCGVHFRKHG